VNTYLIDDDPLTLVDAGPNSATSLMALEAGLAEHGRRVEDLERLVVTHQHIDHIGLTQILADRSGAEVCSLDALAPWLAATPTGWRTTTRSPSRSCTATGSRTTSCSRCAPCPAASGRGARAPR
jgi:glyoxylase-like metal-dependent hydrolase (beta-lactamase superfamily II)